MLEKSSEVSGTQNHFESETTEEISAFTGWVKEFAEPILTALENRDARITLKDEIFLKLSGSLEEMFPNGFVPDMYRLLKERISFILMSDLTIEDQKRDLYKLLHREKLFTSPEGIVEFLRKQPH